MTIDYTDPRVRQLAEARYRLTGNEPIVFGLLVDLDPLLVQDARDWLRAAAAAGMVPDRAQEYGCAGPVEVLRWLVSLDDPDGPGCEARRAVTLGQIIDRARKALGVTEDG